MKRLSDDSRANTSRTLEREQLESTLAMPEVGPIYESARFIANAFSHGDPDQRLVYSHRTLHKRTTNETRL
jgi:hypothetical protein